jgi:hypothetical protein
MNLSLCKLSVNARTHLFRYAESQDDPPTSASFSDAPPNAEPCSPQIAKDPAEHETLELQGFCGTK